MSEPLRLGIAGLGTVGASVVRLIQENAELYASRAGRAVQVSAVSARDKSKDRGISLEGICWAESPMDLIGDDVDCVVELIGGADGMAHELVSAALDAGKDVITANKALIATHGFELAQKAEGAGAALMCEAAVAGGIPILGALRSGLIANNIERIAGIMNGTCNYILTTMEKTGRDFEDVLGEAQALGYAEADPTFDVDGMDTAHKLVILASMAFAAKPNLSESHLHCEGIRSITPQDITYASELGYRIKLLGITEQIDGALSQRVHPCLVPLDASIAGIDGAFNAVQVGGHAVGRTLFEGAGAGGDATASAVLADVLDLARGITAPTFLVKSDALNDAVPAPMDTLRGHYYLRIAVADEPGVLEKVTASLAKCSVSVQQCVQKNHADDTPAELVIITHEAQENNMMAAYGEIEGLEITVGTPQLIRMMN